MDKKLIHSTEFVIRWIDQDGFHHVNNATYFDYMQEARFKWLLESNIFYDPKTLVPVLSHTECKFIRPMVYPATILVDTYFLGEDGKKNIFEHEIKDAVSGNIYAKGTATIVWFDVINQCSIMTPEAARIN